jgi:CTP synthase
VVRQRSLVPPFVGSNPSAPAKYFHYLFVPRIIFVTGGVVSSLGKGIASASIGSLLKSYNYNVTVKKLDPYLNVDPGTMNPIQHGEVFVTNDGAETDLDLGHYERFLDLDMSSDNNITSGKIYKNLIEKERKGDYLGATVQVIPHVTDLIKEFIMKNSSQYDFIIVEIGGTVGDIECKPFLEAIRQLSLEIGKGNSLFIHLTLIPYLDITNEIKTKPTQHSVRDLMYSGIEPDILLCRTKIAINDAQKSKISLFCNVQKDCVIEAPDVKNIYSLPYIYAKNGLLSAISRHFALNIKTDTIDILEKWHNYAERSRESKKKITLLIAGKYGSFNDCYKSIFEAIGHSSTQLSIATQITFCDTKLITKDSLGQILENVDAIIIPGGFGNEGTDGKINIIRFARENNIPLLGICFGMQLAVIEFARSVAKIEDANSTELDPDTKNPIVGIITQWSKENGVCEKRDYKSQIGGTMRLGKYKAIVKENTLAYEIYRQQEIAERHRHRYEINYSYCQKLESFGCRFSAFSKDDPTLPEIFEIKGNDYFITCQFHPEFLSRPFKPHPLFNGLLHAATKRKQSKG